MGAGLCRRRKEGGTMERQDLIRDMKSYVKGSFFTRQKLANYMNIKNPQNVDKYLKGLEKVDGKYYFIPDIASKLQEAKS